MSTERFRAARIEEIAEIDDGRCPFRPIRHELGIDAFGVNSFTARDAGDRLINEHDEADDGHEELYAVLRGRATFELDGEQVDAPAGSLLFVEPGVKRTAFAEEAATTVVVFGAAAGKAYVPFGWEAWAPLNPLYQEGSYDAVVERARDIVESNPYPGVLYNLACCESLAGRPGDAIEHLRRAIERQPGMRDFARGDSDFDAIREDPAFAALVG